MQSAEEAGGRLSAVLRAPRAQGLTPLGPDGPWLATTPQTAKRVLMDAATFDFPNSVSRGTDMSASTADTRTGHYINAPLTPAQVERGREVLLSEWDHALAGAGLRAGAVELEAMDVLRRPVARATCAALLTDLDVATRDDVADRVLAWIDALAPVISSPRSPGRWSRARRGERRARYSLEDALDAVLPGLGVIEPAAVVATMLAAGIQVPIAAGAWLLAFLADHPGQAFDPDHAVWEALRLAPPTWVTARITTTQVDLDGRSLSANEVVLVSPLLLGRDTDLVPSDPSDVGAFDPRRWDQESQRPGAWLPFGAGAHACPGRTLGFGMLRDLAVWSGGHQLSLASSVLIDQSRGLVPSPARIIVTPPA